MASRETITKIIGVLAQFFPGFSGKQTDDGWQGMIGAYYLVLHDIDDALIERAALDLGSRARFFPAAGELRQAAFDLADLADDIPTAQDAWAEVTQALRRGFFYDTSKGWSEPRAPTPEDWSHPAIQQALDGIGGWAALRTSDNPTADRARFVEAYTVYAGRDRQARRMLPAVREAVGQIRAGRPLALPEIVRHITDRGVPVLDLRALEPA